MNAILYATDFSDPSLAAFSHAVAAASREDATLLLCHVLPPAVSAEAIEYVPTRLYDEMEKAVRQRMEKRLTRLAERARRAGVKARLLLVKGNAPEEILRAARKLRTRMIVMGTHGRRGIARLVLGSVASRVVAGAPCPVLTVRG